LPDGQVVGPRPESYWLHAKTVPLPTQSVHDVVEHMLCFAAQLYGEPVFAQLAQPPEHKLLVATHAPVVSHLAQLPLHATLAWLQQVPLTQDGLAEEHA